jgi:hypothetical protein
VETVIIDVHTHIGCTGEYLPWAWWEEQRSTKFRNIVTKGKNWTEPLSKFSPTLSPDPWDISDADGDTSYKKMVEVGIDKCVLLPLDFQLMGLGRYRQRSEFSVQKKSIEEQNKHMTDVAARRPDAYIPFCTIDPRRGEEGLGLVERAVREWGAKGIKLHPSSGWFPNDRDVCYPLYELCIDLDIPVLTHCGPEGGYGPAKYGDAFHWDDVLSDFPELRLCLAHAGGSMGEFLGGSLLGPATSILFFYDNAFMDLSCAALIYVRDPVRFYKELRELLDGVGGKVMWGTDSPWMTNRGPGWKTQLEWFRNPNPEFLEKAGVSFTEAEIDDVLGENARHWLKLDENG